MSVDRPLTLPGSRILRTWWATLAACQPRRLWYAHLLLHRVEVLVEVQGLAPQEQLDHALLGWIAHHPPPSREALLASLHFPPAYLDSLLRRYQALGWLNLDPPRLTPAGRDRWQSRAAPGPRLERRWFTFLEGPNPAFVALAPEALQPLPAVPSDGPVGDPWNPASLDNALTQPADWKTRHGFPEQVIRWLRLPPEPSEMHSPRVPLVHSEQATLVLVESQRDHGAILAHRVSPEPGHLDPAVVWRLPNVATLEELAPLPEAAWRESWLAWCQARQLPLADAESSQLRFEGHQLHVQAPPRLIEQLRQGRSESLEGAAWILTARGRIRAAACLHLVPV
jgi:hypothetical protein